MLWDGVSPLVFLPFFLLLHTQTTHFTQQQQGLVFCFTLSLTPFISPPLHQQQPHSQSIPPPSSTIFSHHHPQGQGVGGFTSHQHILSSTQSSFNTPCSSHNKSPSTNSTSWILNNNNKERQLIDRGCWNHLHNRWNVDFLKHWNQHRGEWQETHTLPTIHFILPSLSLHETTPSKQTNTENGKGV